MRLNWTKKKSFIGGIIAATDQMAEEADLAKKKPSARKSLLTVSWSTDFQRILQPDGAGAVPKG